MEKQFEEDFTDYKVEKVVTTCQKHYWIESGNQDENSELLSVNCIHCPTGASINTEKFRVENGEICGN